MEGRAPARCQRGFTIVELLTVVGLIALLVALFLPVVGRVRTAAASAACLSNLKQIGTAWRLSTADELGRLAQYHVNTPDKPAGAWERSWLRAVDRQKVSAATLLCPAAATPTPSDATRGYGSAKYAWTGRYGPFGTAICLDRHTYREGSYGLNRWVVEGGGAGDAGGASFLTDVKEPANVPVFFDCAYADARPSGGSIAAPVPAPPDLTGAHAAPGNPEHWKVLLARHGRGVNVYRADGSAAWVRLEELYLLTWKSAWEPQRLSLPRN